MASILASFSLASGGTQSYTKLQPGSYSVTENAPPAGWALDSLTCPTVSGPGTSVTFDGAKANITLGFLGNVECTYVNKRQPQVRVVKVLDPANDPGKFDLQINGQTHADDVGNGGDTGFKQVTAGQPVTVGELAGAGTSLANYVSSVSCDSGKGGAVATSHSFSVDFGDQVTCTITNTRKGAIVVEKQTLPDGSTQQFSFTPSYGAAFQLSDGQQNTSAPLAPGSYSVSESVPAGWSLTSATCDDGSSPSSIALGAGETVKCTFTNSKDGKVIVKKVMVGGTDTFTFTGTPAGSISANNGTIEQGVVAGQYVSTEGVTAGWTLTSITCSDGNSSGSVPNRSATFNVEPNETVTCTFTNTKQSRIVVEKQTNPDGDTQVFGFNASYDANGFSLSDGQQDDSGPLAAGTYSVSENVPAGWDLKSTVCSDGSPGERDRARSRRDRDLRLHQREGRGDHRREADRPDGHAQVFSFSASYDANGFSLSDGQQNDSGDLNPGTYSVSENVPAGWNLTSTVCDDQSPVTAIDAVGRRDRDLRLQEHAEARGDHRREADAARRRPAGVRLHVELRPGRLLALGRTVERLRRPPARHLLGLRDRAGGLGPEVHGLHRRLARERDRGRPGRDRALRLHEREGREHRRREADEPERRHAGLRVHGQLRRETASRSRTVSRTTPGT